MIRILAFRAKNFLSFDELAYSLPDSTLTLVGGAILGDDSKSNGAGKSAFWEVVPYALYGKTVRGVAGEDVIRRGQTSCDVSILLDIDNDRYEIQRGRGKGKPILRVLKNSEDITQVDSLTTQGMIESVLGMSYELFINSVLFGQGLSYRFVQAPDSEKKEIFEQLLALDWLRDAQAKAKEILDSAKFEWVSLDRKKSETGFTISGLEEERERWVSSKAGSFDNIPVRKDVILNRLSKLELEMDELSKEQEQADKDYATAVAEEKEILGLSKKIDIGARLMASHLDYWERKRKQTKLSMEGKTKMVGIICPTCEQVVPASHIDKIMTETKGLLETLTDFIERDKKHLAEWGGLIVDLVEEGRLLEKALLESQDKQASLGMEISRLEGEVNQVSTALALLEKEEEDFKNWQKNKQEIETKIEEQKALLADYEIRMEKKAKEVEVIEFWVDGFGNRGVKSLMLDSVTEWMNQVSENFSARVSGGEFIPIFSSTTTMKSGLEKEAFSVSVRRGDEVVDYKSISGGEKRRVDVIVLLTLCKLLNTTAGKEVNLLVFDEVFESLDSSGIEDVVNVLKEFKDEGKCVYVISHQEEARSLFEEEVLVVKDENGVSFVGD